MNIGMTFSLIPLPTPQILPARRYASAGTSYGPVSVCLSRVGVLSKRLNESGTLFQTLDLEIATAYPLSKRLNNLARQCGRSQRDKLERRRSTALTILPTLDRCSNHQARCRRAGLLATADTCSIIAILSSNKLILCESICLSTAILPSILNDSVNSIFPREPTC